MEAYEELMRSLVLPMSSKPAVVPNAAVAEIVGFREPNLDADKPEWFLGKIEWRGLSIPVISYEASIENAHAGVNSGVRIAIMNSITGDSIMPFYGIVTQGIPHLANLRDGDIVVASEEIPPGSPILQNVILHGQDAFIPDLHAVEDMVKQAI